MNRNDLFSVSESSSLVELGLDEVFYFVVPWYWLAASIPFGHLLGCNWL